MTIDCPYCGAQMEQRPLHERLTKVQLEIYETVVAAGPEGVLAIDLLEKHLPGRNIGTLRSRVYSINQIINPMCLRGRKEKYYLERVKWSTEGLDTEKQQVE